MDKKIKLKVQSITNSVVHTGAYALLLAEENGERLIPIIVGTSEAQSIAVVMEGVQPPRPLTHDLFANFMNLLHVKLCEVFIYRFEDGVFYSELLFEEGDRQLKLDSRTSDAIAIALRVQCPIYIHEQIMDKCSIHLEDLVDSQMIEEGINSILENDEADELMASLKDTDPTDFTDEAHLQIWLESLSEEELNDRLNESVRSENYEYAKIYKDELHRREKEK